MNCVNKFCRDENREAAFENGDRIKNKEGGIIKKWFTITS
jgi:hypothetical protein